MKQHQLNVLLCALILFAISPLMALANNEDVLMELTPKRVEVGPSTFTTMAGPMAKLRPNLRRVKPVVLRLFPPLRVRKCK